MVIGPQNTLLEGLFGVVPADGGAILPAGETDFATTIMRLMGEDTIPYNSENNEIMAANDTMTVALAGVSDIKTGDSVQARLIFHTPEGEKISIPILITISVPGEGVGLAVRRSNVEIQGFSDKFDESDSDSMVTPLAVVNPHEISDIHAELPITNKISPLSTDNSVFPYPYIIITPQVKGLQDVAESKISQLSGSYRSISMIPQADRFSSSNSATGKTVAESKPGILSHGNPVTQSDYSALQETTNSKERKIPADVLRWKFDTGQEFNIDTTKSVHLVISDSSEYTHHDSKNVQAPQKTGATPVIMMKIAGGEVPVVMGIPGTSPYDYPANTMLEKYLVSGAQIDIVLDAAADGDEASIQMFKEFTDVETIGANGSESVDKLSEIKQTETNLSVINQKNPLKSDSAVSGIRHNNGKSSVFGNDYQISGTLSNTYIEEYSPIKYTSDLAIETHQSNNTIFSQSRSHWSSGGVGTVSKPADIHRTFTRTPVNPPDTINLAGDQEAALHSDSAEHTIGLSGAHGGNKSLEGLPFTPIHESEVAKQEGLTELTGRPLRSYGQNDSNSESKNVTTKTVGGTVETKVTQQVDIELSSRGSSESNSVAAIENRESADGMTIRAETEVSPDINNFTSEENVFESIQNQGDAAITHRQSPYETTVSKTDTDWINDKGIITANRDIIVEDENSTERKTPQQGDVKSAIEITNGESSKKTEIVTVKGRTQVLQSQKIQGLQYELSGDVIDNKISFIHDKGDNSNGTVEIPGEVSSSSTEFVVNRIDTNTIPSDVPNKLSKNHRIVTSGNSSEKVTVNTSRSEFSSGKPESVLVNHTVETADVSDYADAVRSETYNNDTSTNSMGNNVSEYSESETHTMDSTLHNVSGPRNLSYRTDAQIEKSPIVVSSRKEDSVLSENQEHPAGKGKNITPNTSTHNSEQKNLEHVTAPENEKGHHQDPDLKPGKVSTDGNSTKEAPVVDKTGGSFNQTGGDSALNSNGGQSEYQSRNFEPIRFDDGKVYGGSESVAHIDENQSPEMADKSSGNTVSAGMTIEPVLNTDNVSGQFRFAGEDVTPGVIESRLTNTIVRNARFLITGGQSSALIKLEPPNLGKLKLEIVTENSKITGKITVESHEVKEMIQNSISSLKEQLSESGLKVEAFDVQVGHNSGTDSWANREYAENLRMNFHRNIAGFANAAGEKSPTASEPNYSKSIDSEYLDIFI